MLCVHMYMHACMHVSQRDCHLLFSRVLCQCFFFPPAVVVGMEYALFVCVYLYSMCVCGCMGKRSCVD